MKTVPKADQAFFKVGKTQFRVLVHVQPECRRSSLALLTAAAPCKPAAKLLDVELTVVPADADEDAFATMICGEAPCCALPCLARQPDGRRAGPCWLVVALLLCVFALRCVALRVVNGVWRVDCRQTLTTLDFDFGHWHLRISAPAVQSSGAPNPQPGYSMADGRSSTQ